MKLTHLDDEGKVRMVDVSEKEISCRMACATGTVRMKKQVMDLLKEKDLPKGDVMTVAKIAGIQAAKETSRLIPLCHPLQLDNVNVDIQVTGEETLKVSSQVFCNGKTGVEMEALTAVAVACLTVYDMCKALDREIEIGEIRMTKKSGGRSGTYESTR